MLVCVGPSLGEEPVADVGVFGTTYPILEKNIITVLKEKMTSGTGKELLHALENKLNDVAEQAHYIPKPISGMTATTELKSYLFDPSISLSHDLVDHQGTRFYTAGDRLNPLDHMTLSKDYVFIDGDRPKQIEWAKQKQREKDTTIVLLKGDPMTLMNAHGITVFFDQEGAMTHRFNLRHVPCVMRQEGKKLRITELTEEEIPS